jgi:fluoride ion exporter CrcB/FEX
MVDPISTSEIIRVAIGGAIGALAKDIFVDGCLQLPEIKEKKIYLGFIGGLLIGVFVGISIDGTFVTALTAGFTGASIITKLAQTKPLENIKIK